MRAAEPRVVIDAGDDAGLATVREHHATHDIHLPQLVGARSLPRL